ncbi:AraC family transcriptional regulator [Aliikangiella sp. G2MR2-5]|uniref:helix-turn-helix domain-containing protein n=1 Tax=Aliikangiella sp. G2MR2-5 TaxID=2788943 RepID=UPI001AEE1204|nr:helix-turn-helix transcriptional regulator [Aliikangiella sp. G2MR2-5]
MSVNVVPIVVYSGMMGVTIFALLDATFKPRQRQTTFLIGLLVLLLIHILGELYIYTGAYQYMPALAGVQLPIRVLLGPALYFYACATMSANGTQSKRAYLTALLGPLLVTFSMVPFAFGLSSEEKLALADPLTRDPENFKLALAACTISMLVFIVFTGIYLFAALKLHRRHRAQLMDRFATIERRSLDWFRVVLILWGCIWLMYAIEYITAFMNWRWIGSGVVLPILEASVLVAFTYLALNQTVLNESDKVPSKTSNNRVAALSIEKMELIADKLNKVMAEKKLFMEEELSLNRLSVALSVSENHISETLSQYLKTNFFHFVNGFRIEEAKKLLQSTDRLVSTIAFEVGFNSKSTFNTAFKKSSGLTPTAFRKQLQMAKAEKG